MDNLGAHMSVSGGVSNAFGEGEAVGAQVMQIFSKNSNQWAAKPLDPAEIKKWLDAWETGNIWEVVVHDSYLINLASPDEALWDKSIEAFKEEMRRCEALRIRYLVMHPGAHMKMGEDYGIARIGDAFNRICRELPDNPTEILIENTAGQGTCLGYRFEHIRDIRALLQQPERFGVCFDTCHALAGGYDFRTKKGYFEVMAEFNRLVGLEHLKVFHINDSKKDLCSRVDRHEHIGEGFVGLEAFTFLMNDERFFDRPMCLETPKVEDMDVKNLGKLRESRTKKATAAVAKAVAEAQGKSREWRAGQAG